MFTTTQVNGNLRKENINLELVHTDEGVTFVPTTSRRAKFTQSFKSLKKTKTYRSLGEKDMVSWVKAAKSLNSRVRSNM